jgi:predicted acylesterase/phospholipase RssA
MRTIISTFIISATLAHEQNLQLGKTCTALVMSGGGSNGAWEAGVLWGLLHYGNPKDYKYDVISGVSAGSINTAAMSGWKLGDELAATEWLSDNWNNTTTDQIYKNWFGGVAHGIFEAGIYDDSPAIDYLTS